MGQFGQIVAAAISVRLTQDHALRIPTSIRGLNGAFILAHPCTASGANHQESRNDRQNGTDSSHGLASPRPCTRCHGRR
jgi:hypothetical protein